MSERKLVLYESSTGRKVAVDKEDVDWIRRIETYLNYLEKEIYQLYKFHNRMVNSLRVYVSEAEREMQMFGETVSCEYDINLQDVNKFSENLTVEVSYEFVN